MKKVTDLLAKIGTNVVGSTVKTATVGIIDIEDIFDKDAELEEEQLLQLISIRKLLKTIADQNSIIVNQNNQIANYLFDITQSVKDK